VLERIGHYEILRKLGEGNMGVVFAARDERLARSVAIKLVHRSTAGEASRSRLWREARAAAAVNHPNICQIYDIGEHEGELYIAMEMLEGEALSDRIARGPLSVSSAVDIASSVLDALSALHQAGVVHRDLKPSNIFVASHGVKLLDFGLARGQGDADQLTTPGMIVGTPRYMAPEQWSASDVGPAADLFACGTILFEMLTGRPAFAADSIPALCHAILHEHPPALAGGSEIQAIDRTISRALAKRPQERYPTAAAMASDLRAIPHQAGATLVTGPRVRTVTRAMVLPFRLLRSDPEIDFLPTSLADAITTSLCGIESVVVRSSRAAASVESDLRKLATEADVDVVLTGNILRVATQLRLTAQLIDARDGTVIWSKALQSSAADLFELHDELTARLLESLSVQLTRREQQRLESEAPATAHAYELYLRALHVGVDGGSTSSLMTARDLLVECLREDPRFAPALARLGRVYRIIAKYRHGDVEENRRLAEESFRKALELSPDLPVAHFYYTYFELEERGDAPAAMERLLRQVRARPTDPYLFAGLVAACRFGGLYDASAAAHQRARRLDPRIETSFAYTLWFLRDYPQVAEDTNVPFQHLTWLARARMGRVDEAIENFRTSSLRLDGVERDASAAAGAGLAVDRDACVAASLHYAGALVDPEAWYFWAFHLAAVGEAELTLRGLREAIRRNFCCHIPMELEPEFEFLRGHPEFQQLIEESNVRHQHAREVFLRSGGPEVLGSVV
jgi:serine/threonine protein kinase